LVWAIFKQSTVGQHAPKEVMDIRQKNVFYRTARFICCLICFLLIQPALAEQPTVELKHPQGLLWKLQKKGQPDSYLFGTIHLADDRVLALLDKVQSSIEQVDVFAMEIVLDVEGQQTLTRATFFQDGKLLQDYLDDVTLDRINIIMHQYYGITARTVNRMQPWSVMATISSPPPESNKTVLDVELENVARELNKKVVGLETVEEQIDVLSGMKLSEQLWMLSKAVEDFHKSMPMWERLVNGYLQRDLQALMNEQLAMMDPGSKIDDRFMDKLLDQRNIKIVQRMLDIMPKQSLFAAVGALHLPGKNGILQLLERAGYRVQAIY